MFITASTDVAIDVTQLAANLFKICNEIDGYVADADRIHSLAFSHAEDAKGERVRVIHFDGRIRHEQDPHLYSRHMCQLVLGRAEKLFVMHYQPYTGECDIKRNDFESEQLTKIFIKVNRCLDAPVNQHIFGKRRA